MSYIPTNWQAGDTVTVSKLNKIEQGILEAATSSGASEFITPIFIDEITYDENDNEQNSLSCNMTLSEICSVCENGKTCIGCIVKYKYADENDFFDAISCNLTVFDSDEPYIRFEFISYEQPVDQVTNIQIEMTVEDDTEEISYKKRNIDFTFTTTAEIHNDKIEYRCDDLFDCITYWRPHVIQFIEGYKRYYLIDADPENYTITISDGRTVRTFITETKDEDSFFIEAGSESVQK